MIRVVFDTNVVASASFWRGTPFDCLAAWANGRCEAMVSPALLSEYHETIEELSLEYPERPFVEWSDALAESATLVFPMENASGATIDPDDEMILECALAAEADYIVTGDKKHLLLLRQFRDIPIVNPANFLRVLASE
jgi:putative PIN family toxin of toxin-antitoxin system